MLAHRLGRRHRQVGICMAVAVLSAHWLLGRQRQAVTGGDLCCLLQDCGTTSVGPAAGGLER